MAKKRKKKGGRESSVGRWFRNRTPNSERPRRKVAMGRTAHSYGLAAAVLAILLILAFDRAAERSKPPVVDIEGSHPVSTPALEKTQKIEKKDAPVAAPVILPAPRTSRLAEDEVERNAWTYFHPSWRAEPPSAFDRGKNPREPWYTEAGIDLRGVARDPRRRIERDFQVPFELRDRVLFWMLVHARYTSYMQVLHDRNDPGIIYGYLDFTPIYESTGDSGEAWRRVYNIERAVKKELKARLLEAAGDSNTKLLTPWEKLELKALLSRAGALSPKDTAALVDSIRSQTGQRDEFLLALARSRELLPHIESAFQRQNLPKALARIPFVESSFNWRAMSKVGAVGIFQFMPASAKQMVHWDKTKWADPLLQTKGAARMLLIFRSLLPDWTTTVTAYNSGVGRLRRLTTKYRAKSIVPLLEVSDGSSLGFAGKNFYAQFLSVNLIEAYQREIFPHLLTEEQRLQMAFEPFKSFTSEFSELY